MATPDHKNKTYYDVLKIHPSATDREVRDAYLALVKVYHPDKNPGKRKIASLRFKMINEAYNVLKNDACRRQYNKTLKANIVKTGRLKAGNDNKKPRTKPTFWQQCLGLLHASKTEKPSTQPSSNETY